MSLATENTSVITEQIKKIQNDYYAGSGGKNIFFKKNQKYECAEQVASQLNLEELLHYSIYIIPNTNRIFIDYTILKTFLTSQIYENIINKFIDLIITCEEKYGNYEFYSNLDTFTPSAFERYQAIFPLFYQISEKNQRCYSTNMTKCEFLNSPSVIDVIMKLLKPFLDEKTKKLLKVYNKQETPAMIPHIFS
jgi:hypothetical protein